MANPTDAAGRAIAGLLGYNPGPGIYSRLERAVQAMPANVRTQELPGLLKRYKDGVPGWELRETDLEGLIGDAQVIPRQDLLDRVRERSPVYTHKEKMLGGNDQSRSRLTYAPIGESTPSARTIFGDYGQGGDDYREVLLLQPGAVGENYQSHWNEVFGANNAVAHARFDTHGDALRINELQSDLGIHNRKAREYADNNPQIQFGQRLNPPEAAGLPFPLEDAWSDILIKRLALEAARKGHRAIEIASPRAIADKVGGNIDNYEHFYGKVVPGALERLGRKMGGLTDVTPAPGPQAAPGYEAALTEMRDGSPTEGQRALRDAIEALRMIRDASPPGPRPAFDAAPGVAWNRLAAAYMGDGDVNESANLLHGMLAVDMARLGGDASRAAEMMPQLVRLAENHAAAMDRYRRVDALAEAQRNAPKPAGANAAPPGRRYLMSDEMRKRILTQGIGASVLAPLMQENE